MIAIELSGGLGNQLFEYAFIYAQHKKLNTPFLLLKSGKPIKIHRYFELEKNKFYFIDRLLFNHSGSKLFFSHYLRKYFYNIIINKIGKHTITVNNEEEPEVALKKVSDDHVYHGYFQSEDYFGGHHNLDGIFNIRQKHLRAYRQKFDWLSGVKHLVTIHIRRGDYQDAFTHLNLGADLRLPLSYYHNLIARIHQDGNFYMFLSDNIDEIAPHFNYLTHKYFSKESEIIDFQLMLNADTCIIANSTFSWWPAYLNKKAHKTIYCPKNFLGFQTGKDYPSRIYPDEWIKSEV